MRMDGVVPFAMKRRRGNVKSSHVFVADFPARGILPPIKAAGHSQAFGGRRVSNESDDGFIVA